MASIAPALPAVYSGVMPRDSTLPDCAIIPMLPPVITAFIGGSLALTGVWFSNKNSKELLKLQLDKSEQSTRSEILRSRLEELYEVSGKWAVSYAPYHVLLQAAMKGDITYNNAMDVIIDRGSDNSASRMFMLGELYFPDCREQLNEVKRLRDLAESIQSDFKKDYKDNGLPSEKHAEGMPKVLELSVSVIDGYRASLGKYAREV